MNDVQIEKVTVSYERKCLDYFCIFMLIYLPSSFFGITLKGTLNLSILLVVALIAIIVNNKDIFVDIKSLMFFISIIILSEFTMIMNQDTPFQYIIFWASLTSAYIMFLSFDAIRFIYIFVKIMYFLCVFSLFTFALLFIIPSVYNIFPSVTNAAGLTVNNLFFTVVHDSTYFNSNFGMFWEPGAYQTFINLALYFQLFILKDFDVKRITIFLITLFTTFSTTGYLAALFLFGILLFNNKDKTKILIKKRKKLFKTIFALLIIGAIGFSMLPNKIIFKVFGKLEAIINPNLIDQNIAYESTTARIDAIKIPIINFFDSPLWGKGFDNMFDFKINDNINFLTATPFNWFGLFGLLLGILFNFSIWKLTKLSKSSIFIRTLEFLFLNLIMLSEFYNMNAFMLTLIFYGFSNKSMSNNYGQVPRNGEI
jgi:hypothetical protein